MKKFAILLVFINAVFILFIMGELLDWRNDPLYPFYYSEIKNDEKKLELYAGQLCGKLPDPDKSKCRQYKFKVVVFHPIIYLHNTVASTGIFSSVVRLRKMAIDNLNEEEIKFVMAHELAHHLLNTSSEDEANQFAEEMTSRNVRRSFFKKACEMLSVDQQNCAA